MFVPQIERQSLTSIQKTGKITILCKLELECIYCLTQLWWIDIYIYIYIYYLLHRDQLHVSALFIGHLQVDK